MLREFLRRAVIGRLADALGRPQAERGRHWWAASSSGLAMARYVLRIEPLASADQDTVVAAVGPTLERYLTGSLEGYYYY